MDNSKSFALLFQLLFGPVALRLAKESGFRQRRSKLDGANLLAALVSGWSAQAQASRNQLAAYAGCSKQALDQALNQSCATFLYQVLCWLVEQTQPKSNSTCSKPVLNQFTAVYVLDSSSVNLPTALAEYWSGCGGSSGGQAALKIHLGCDLLSGALLGPALTNGKSQDRSGPHQNAALPKGSLRLADLGYFSLKRLSQLAEGGTYYISKVPANLGFYFYDEASQDYQKVASWLARQEASVSEIDIAVQIGQKRNVACRLVAHRLNATQIKARQARIEEGAQRRAQAVSVQQQQLSLWAVYVTNVERERLDGQQVQVVYALRWQIELIFRLWKSAGGELEQWRSGKAWAVLCEIYAKMIGLVLMHWEVMASGGTVVNLSLWKAAAIARSYVVGLVALARCGVVEPIITLMSELERQLKSCKLDNHREHPSSYQRLVACATSTIPLPTSITSRQAVLN